MTRSRAAWSLWRQGRDQGQIRNQKPLLSIVLVGVTESACGGARASHRWQPGTTIGLIPGNDRAAANSFVNIVISTGLDHGRNLLVAQSDAVVAIGGAARTLSEIAFAWIHRRLIIAFTCDGWSGRLAGTRVDERVRYPDQPEDRVFPAVTATEVLAILGEKLPSYSRRHSRIRSGIPLAAAERQAALRANFQASGRAERAA